MGGKPLAHHVPVPYLVDTGWSGPLSQGDGAGWWMLLRLCA